MGIAFGLAEAATPLAFRWLDTATVYAIGMANTRWCLPFCMTINRVVAAIIVVEIAAGLHFR